MNDSPIQAYYSTLPIPCDTNSIRLLHVKAPIGTEGIDIPVRCALSVEVLGTEPYTALSYAWGTMAPQPDTMVGRTKHQETRNRTADQQPSYTETFQSFKGIQVDVITGIEEFHHTSMLCDAAEREVHSRDLDSMFVWYYRFIKVPILAKWVRPLIQVKPARPNLLERRAASTEPPIESSHVKAYLQLLAAAYTLARKAPLSLRRCGDR